jgi:hypothetical protein
MNRLDTLLESISFTSLIASLQHTFDKVNWVPGSYHQVLKSREWISQFVFLLAKHVCDLLWRHIDVVM